MTMFLRVGVYTLNIALSSYKLIGEITNPSVLCGCQLFAFSPDNVFWIECICLV